MALDSYLVKIGVKGQEVVLSEMDRIQRKGNDLSKKKLAVDLALKTTEKKEKPKVQKTIEKATTKSEAKPEALTRKTAEKKAKIETSELEKVATEKKAKTKTEKLAEPKPAKVKKPAEKKEKTFEEADKRKKKTSEKDDKNTNKFGKSVDKFGNSTTNLARSASSFDPASVIKSGLSELSKIAVAGIPFAIAGAALSTATGSIAMAKANVAGQYALARRNAMAGFYGENVSFAEKTVSDTDKTRISELNKSINRYEKQRQTAAMQKQIVQLVAGQVLTRENPEAIAKEKRYQRLISRAEREKYGIQEKYTSKWSNEEMAMLRTSIGQAYGRIQQPLADAINQFTMDNKFDPNALARVAAGNWRSTGTDRGWILQQITDSLGDVPPTIAQKLQASLLKQYGAEEIQKATPEQIKTQSINAAWANRNEQQISQVFDAINKSATELLGLNNKLNELQVQMVKAGTGVATALNFVGNQITSMTHKIKTGN